MNERIRKNTRLAAVLAAILAFTLFLSGCAAGDAYNDMGELSSTDAAGAAEAGWSYAEKDGGSFKRLPGSVRCGALPESYGLSAVSRDTDEAFSGTLSAFEAPVGLKAYPVSETLHIMPLAISGEKAFYIADDTAVADLDTAIGIPLGSMTDISGESPQAYIAEHGKDIGGATVLAFPVRTAATFRYTEDGEPKSINLDTSHVLCTAEESRGTALPAAPAGDGSWSIDTSALGPGTWILASDSAPSEIIRIQ